jgi:NADPH:quinone reductase-like Zn-dependent oxidoreductase
MLVTRGRLRPGEEVLILAAGAGVGTACLQIARLAGARVIATAGSEEKCARLRAEGADEVIDHSKEDVAARVRALTGKRGVDLAVDYVGKETWVKSLRCLRKGGRLVTCGATSGHDPVEDLRHIFFRQLEVIGSTMGSRRELEEVLGLVFSGKLKPIVDRTLPLEQAVEAHRLVEARRVFGKVVLLA